jgi:superfamily II RNA helicase
MEEQAGPPSSTARIGRRYHDKTIHVIVLESESEEEIAKIRRSISFGSARGVNVLQFKIGDDVLRALLAALEESARLRTTS